jgi:hypothetical protein
METYDLTKFTADDFKAILTQDVQIHFLNEHSTSARVLQITDLFNYSPSDRSSFSVVFMTAGVKQAHQQGIYRISHPTFNDIHVFIVPISDGPDGVKYEAVFS